MKKIQNSTKKNKNSKFSACNEIYINFHNGQYACKLAVGDVSAWESQYSCACKAKKHGKAF